MKDSFNREIDYMRISITDRCNLRCRYCMPEEGIEKVAMNQILTYEEILRVCDAAVSLGINKFKVTGGEPLVRRGCVGFCKDLKNLHGVKQVTLTTNGQMLGSQLPALVEAGIDGINISLDSLQEDRYRMITGGGELKTTIDSVEAAVRSGVKTKVNCLIQKGFNEDEIEDFAQLAFTLSVDVRFIEIMPIGYGKPDTGLPNRTILQRLKRNYPRLAEDAMTHGNGPAVYYSLPNKAGSIGLISAMNESFCGNCNRIRLTSQGTIKPCLCYEDSIDLKPSLEEGSKGALQKALSRAVLCKPAGHTFEHKESVERRSMAQIGG